MRLPTLIAAWWLLGSALLAQSGQPALRDARSDAARANLSANDWAALRTAVDEARYAAVVVDGQHRASNPTQGFTTRFDGRGFCVTPTAAGWSFGLDLACYGGDLATHSVTAPLSVLADGPRIAYRWDDTLTEWYVNDSRGLEHGFTMQRRPAGARDALELELFIRGGLHPSIAADGRNVGLVDAAGTTVLRYDGLVVIDADARELAARFEAIAGGLRLVIDDRAARYPVTIDPVVQQAYLKASNTEAVDHFGWSVAIDGDTAVVGAVGEDSSGTGADPESDNSANGAGAVYVFVRSGTTWSQQAYLKASNAEALDEFGGSVAVSGDTIVVGAMQEASSATGVDGDQTDNSAPLAGAAYVFVRSGSTWSQQAYLKASNTGMFDLFGRSVAVSGDTIVVGADGEASNATGVDGDQTDDSALKAGAAYVFARNGTTWSQQAYLKASNTESGDFFGISVGVAGDTALVGAYFEASAATGIDGNQADNSAGASGAAYLFVRSGTTWSQQAYVKASNTESGDQFGIAVALSGDSAVVGAHAEDSKAKGVNGDESDNSELYAGAAYVFVRSATTWSQQAYLKASNTGRDDLFGAAVSIGGDTVVVGAAGEDSRAKGVDGNQGDNGAAEAGAAYVFTRSGVTWSQKAYLKASNTASKDDFGHAVAASGDAVLVGAYQEDSNATGVDGDQGDNQATAAGAAYLFDLDQAAGSFASYGAGTPGLGGFVPSATLDGSWFISEDVTLSIRDGLGGAPALLLVGFGRASLPFAGGQLLVATPWVTVNLTLGGTTGAAGAGTLDVSDTIEDDPALVGLLVDFQVLVADPAAQKKLALSNGAELLIGG